MAGILYLVATPIGNLQDMTFRAVEVLRMVDIIACEDTRHSIKLLNHFRISNKLVSYHEHNEHERADELIDKLKAGSSVALISDAGTPAISDPGRVVVKAAIEAGIAVVPVPGAAAFVVAAIASGLPVGSLFFGGFLPSKKGDRRRRLEELASLPATLVIYESPHRIEKSLLDCLEILGDRRAVIARELTKLHEEFLRGTLSELIAQLARSPIKGEIVLAIDRPSKGTETADASISIAKLVANYEADGQDRKAAIKKAAKDRGISKSEAYRELERQKQGQ
ncbi:MAG: 16S rRNA (cytidine(1402)-2'-O)-methyltransferase [Blastocatellia bacterium]|nr:16S rRNA (cytidine(1402)-2'-O)-methyltransferase [Blastocatellia bacterium]